MIPSSVTSIGASAFSGCSSLISINIPEGVTAIGNHTFENCTGLNSVVIPSSVTSIGASAFWGCWSLNSIVIPEGVTTISSNSFLNCNSLTSVVIPSSVTSIEGGAFFGCSSLTSVEIPPSVTSIGDSAFSGCSSLLSINIPEGVTVIRFSTFENCSGLTSVVIPSSVTSIGASAFSGCSGLTSVVIPSSVTSIYNDAFSGCSGLTSIVIPSGLTSIGDGAFSGCSSLTSINIPEGVTTIGYRTFSGCSDLTSVVIPSSVTSIGNFAFYGCSDLASIVIPSSVTNIGELAFSGCSGLNSVHILDIEAWCNISFLYSESNPLYYAHHLFLSGVEVKNLVIPNTITAIRNYAFTGCSGLNSVEIPEGVISIGASAFSGCDGLSSIKIPWSMRTIGTEAFWDCGNLTSVNVSMPIPISISSNTFSNRANAILTVPADRKPAYEAADYWNEFMDIVEGTTVSDMIFIDITEQYLTNTGFDEDLTFQIDGTTKPIISTTTSLSDRSWAYIAEDNSVYAKPKTTSSQSRPDGRKLEAVNGFVGQVKSWELESNYTFPKCEWVYFGTIPYDLENQVIPITDDGSTYLEVPNRPAIASSEDNVGFVYFRASWGSRAVYKQIANLPKAKYSLEYWTINLNPNATNGKNLAKVTCGENEYVDESGLNDIQWTKHVIAFYADGETCIELGYESLNGSLSNPFLCIDDVKLFEISQAEHLNSIHAFIPSLIMGKQATLSLNLTNEDELIAFEFDLQLPDGITIAKDEDNDPIATLSSRASKHSLAVSEKGNGLYHFLCYSGENKIFSGNEGELLTIELLCDGNIAVGTYQATVKNIIFSDVDKNKITPADITFDLEVIEAEPGDVNKDGEINVMDVVEMVAYIMGDGAEGFVFAAADLYPDGAINVMDLVNLVDLIMNSSASNAREWTDNSMSLSTLADGVVSVKVNNPEQYVASEFIVEVSAGQTLETVTADKHHRVTCSQLDDSHYKVMTYSSANSTFNSDALVQLHISGEGMVNVHDALLVDESRKGVAFAPTAGGYTTGINQMENGKLIIENSSVYDLQGKKRDTSRPYRHEVLIVNGKKQMVR